MDGKCYRYFKEPARWSAARDTCQKADGDLITVNSNQELSLVSESVSCDNSGSIWLGYSDVSNQIHNAYYFSLILTLILFHGKTN